MISQKASFKNEALYSDDKQHQFMIRRIWNPSLPSVAIIMLAPSEAADEVATDMTGMYVVNNCYKLGFGSVAILNLYSQLNSGTYGNCEENDAAILKACKDCDKIILAYGTGNQTKQVCTRIREIYELLRPYADKLYQITTQSGAGYHPLGAAVRHRWELSLLPLPQTSTT